MTHGSEHAFNCMKVCYFCGIGKLLALMTKGDCPRRVGVHADVLPAADTPDDDRELRELADHMAATFGTPDGLRRAWIARLNDRRKPREYVGFDVADDAATHPCA